MEIEVFCVTADGGERFAVLRADADLHKILGLDGPFTETELRAHLAELEMSTPDIESQIARARTHAEESATDR